MLLDNVNVVILQIKLINYIFSRHSYQRHEITIRIFQLFSMTALIFSRYFIHIFHKNLPKEVKHERN